MVVSFRYPIGIRTLWILDLNQHLGFLVNQYYLTPTYTEISEIGDFQAEAIGLSHRFVQSQTICGPIFFLEETLIFLVLPIITCDPCDVRNFSRLGV